MKAHRTGPESSERATIETDDGDSVYLSSYNDESLDAVVSVLNEYGKVLAQRDALAAALKPFAALADEIEQNPLGSARYAFDDTPLEVADCIAARAALALARVDQKSDDATA